MLESTDIANIKQLLSLLLLEIHKENECINNKLENLIQDLDEFMQYYYLNEQKNDKIAELEKRIKELENKTN